MKRNPTEQLLPEKITDALLEAIKPVQPETSQAKNLRTRVLNKIHEAKAAESRDLLTVEKDKGDWVEVSPLAKFKMLLENGNSSSFIVKLEAGAEFPGHEHPEDEECVMLEGDLWIGDLHLFAGDYHMAPQGVHHGDIRTDTGALLFFHGPIPEPMFPFI